jgi:hypothetical protein
MRLWFFIVENKFKTKFRAFYFATSFSLFYGSFIVGVPLATMELMRTYVSPFFSFGNSFIDALSYAIFGTVLVLGWMFFWVTRFIKKQIEWWADIENATKWKEKVK